VELAPGCLPAAYEIVRSAGGSQSQGVTPDIVTLAKVSNIRIVMNMFD
jgi:hypothetical protein